MNLHRFQTQFFLAALLSVIVLTLLMLGSYLQLLAFGAVLAVVCRPLYRWMLRRRFPAGLAAGLLVSFMGVAVLVPVGLGIISLYWEAADLLAQVSSQLSQGVSSGVIAHFIPARYLGQVTLMFSDTQAVIKTVAGYLTASLPSLFTNVMAASLGFFVILFSAYYFLKDARLIKKTMMALSPLKSEDDEAVAAKVMSTVSAVVYGVIVIALVKGALAVLFDWLFGVPQPFFWGIITGVASVIPIVGVTIVSVVAALYLLATGHTIAAIGLAVVSLGIVGNIDLVLQPMLVAQRVNIHPLLILLSVFGGLSFYGFSGFILGPLTMAVAVAFLDIYKKEFRKGEAAD